MCSLRIKKLVSRLGVHDAGVLLLHGKSHSFDIGSFDIGSFEYEQLSSESNQSEVEACSSGESSRERKEYGRIKSGQDRIKTGG